MNDAQAKAIISKKIKWLKARGQTKVSVLDFKLPYSQVERILEKNYNEPKEAV